MSLYQAATLLMAQSISRRRQLLAGYRLNLQRGEANVRDMIRQDIIRFCDLGARRHASDLSQVLKQFELAHPSALSRDSTLDAVR